MTEPLADAIPSYIPDDYKVVPEKIQIRIATYIEETFFPSIVACIEDHCPKFFRTPLRCVSFRKFFRNISSLKSSPFIEKYYDHLLKLEIVKDIPATAFCKILWKDLIGAAIHISKGMGKPGFEDELRNLVKGCFIPYEEPDFTYPSRKLSSVW